MLVLDANILIRAVLGTRVRGLLVKYAQQFDFVAPDAAMEEARQHLPRILQRRGLEERPFLEYFASLNNVIQVVELDTYASFEAIARQRLARRDENDWPVLATALALGCPIWTEDTDFFGCGVAIWRRIVSNCTYRKLKPKTKVPSARRCSARRLWDRSCLRRRGWSSSSSARIWRRRLS